MNMTQASPVQKQSTRIIILSFVSYLALFIGTAFISGAIVHSGNLSDIPKYIAIGIVGVSLFLAGSFIQESILNKTNLREEGVLKFFIFSLLLSIGVGMISGGAQHFTDFPVYSSYLVPLGLVLSVIAYLLKNNYHITKKLWGVIIAAFVLIAIPLYFGLGAYANSLVKAQSDKCKTSFNLSINALAGGEGHEEPCPLASSKNSASQTDAKMGTPHNMSAMVKDDRTFLQNMIPHHQEAVDSSTLLLKTTKDADLITFAKGVVSDQNKEISEMKILYKQWYKQDYTVNTSYVPMMGSMTEKTGPELDKEYISQMIEHHEGAVTMAKKAFPVSEKVEIRSLASSIVNNQEKEIITLKGWLTSKYNTTPITSSAKSSKPAMQMHSDGHIGH